MESFRHSPKRHAGYATYLHTYFDDRICEHRMYVPYAIIQGDCKRFQQNKGKSLCTTIIKTNNIYNLGSLLVLSDIPVFHNAQTFLNFHIHLVT